MSPSLCYGFMGPSSSPQGRHRRWGDDTGVKGVQRSEVEEGGSQETRKGLAPGTGRCTYQAGPGSAGATPVQREEDRSYHHPSPTCLPGDFKDQINQGLYKVSVNNQRRYTCLIRGVLPSHVNEIFLFKYVFLKWLN